MAGRSGEWRNRQTRRIQVPVSERMWGFKSPLAHPPTHSTHPPPTQTPQSTPTNHQGVWIELRVAGTNPGCGRSFCALRTGEDQILGKTPEFRRTVVRKDVRSLPPSKFWARRSPLSKWSARIGVSVRRPAGNRVQRRLRQRQPQDLRIEWSDSGLLPIHFCLASKRATSTRSPATSRKNWTRYVVRWRLIERLDGSFRVAPVNRCRCQNACDASCARRAATGLAQR